MKVINESLLEEFRTAGLCEWCHAYCARREPAHIFAKGMGGGGRLDLRCNLVALGSTPAMCCECHADHHAGHSPLRCDLLAIVARREDVLQGDIEEVVWLFRRLPKNCDLRTFGAEVLELYGPARKLAWKEWFAYVTYMEEHNACSRAL